MITQPQQQRRGRAAVLVLGVALVGVVALATSRAAPHALFSSLFKKKDRVSFEDATATSQYLELPEGCKIRGGMIINLMNSVIDTALNHQKLPTPPDPQKERKMISMETGTSLVMYNKSTTAMHVGHIEVATCWIPGPEGNKILPDRLAVTVTNVIGTQHLQYDLEQNFFGFTHGLGGGEMKVTVTGFLHLPLIDLHDLNNTVKGCTGKVGMQSMWASGPHGIEGDPVALDRADVVADQQMIHDMCLAALPLVHPSLSTLPRVLCSHAPLSPLPSSHRRPSLQVLRALVLGRLVWPEAARPGWRHQRADPQALLQGLRRAASAAVASLPLRLQLDRQIPLPRHPARRARAQAGEGRRLGLLPPLLPSPQPRRPHRSEPQRVLRPRAGQRRVTSPGDGANLSPPLAAAGGRGGAAVGCAGLQAGSSYSREYSVEYRGCVRE